MIARAFRNSKSRSINDTVHLKVDIRVSDPLFWVERFENIIHLRLRHPNCAHKSSVNLSVNLGSRTMRFDWVPAAWTPTALTLSSERSLFLSSLRGSYKRCNSSKNHDLLENGTHTSFSAHHCWSEGEYTSTTFSHYGWSQEPCSQYAKHRQCDLIFRSRDSDFQYLPKKRQRELAQKACWFDSWGSRFPSSGRLFDPSGRITFPIDRMRWY